MKKIVYITTSMDEGDFKEYITHWSKAPNPSNQNFHNKLVRALSLSHHVDVISIRPFSRGLCDIHKLDSSFKITNNITWHYLEIKHCLFAKLISCHNEMKKILKGICDQDTVIFTDTINSGVVTLLSSVRKSLNNAKIVGVVTDSPSNISGVGRSYTEFILKHANNFDGYLSLTKELDDLYNVHHKPSLIVEGLVENRQVKDSTFKNINYFFFGGALLPRYGVYELITAFQEFNKDFPDFMLFIAGHHADEEKLLHAIGDNHNIRYLKCLPVDEVLSLEKNAFANINPRPFSEDLDRYSIPSKTLEYLISNKPTICVKNTKLIKYFEQEIIWAKSGDAQDLKEAMIKVATASEEIRKHFAEIGKEKALKLFSLETINKRIDNELIDVIFQ